MGGEGLGSIFLPRALESSVARKPMLMGCGACARARSPDLAAS